MLTFFHSPDGKSWYRVNDTPLDGSFLVRWDRVARPGLIHRGRTNEPAVFNYFNLNHIRHSFAVNILNNGANIKTVASLLGHSGLKHMEKYTRAVDELKQKAIDSLPELKL